MLTYKYIILGGGLSAGYAAQEFVEMGGPAGELCILSAEETLPYERPPLSKGFLAGDKTEEQILINSPDFYQENGISVSLGTTIERVDFDERKLFSDSETFAYDKLVIATGSRPRMLDIPGSHLENVFYLRQVDDAKRIRRQAERAQRAVVLGGSFIGMETTAVLQSLGLETTMVFPDERVWQSFFTAPMSDFFEKYYRDRGVKILAETKAASFEGDKRVTRVALTSGQSLEADLVVAGIGVMPNTGIFQGSGLQIGDDGIKVNRFLETNMPDVLAMGDVTLYEDVLYNRPIHIEHWDNAVEQGRHAARVMMGEYQPYEHVPYFFSDEFDLSYEFWGDTKDAAQAIHRGDVPGGSFSVWWLAENGRLLAAFVMNRPEVEREAAPGWIKTGKQLPAEWLQEIESLELAS
jgi:3-phenylpropionate/trans-cinnamate dioxygenase ferredoxin reductase component